MAGRRREQLRAEWTDRLRRFRKRPLTDEEFFRVEGLSQCKTTLWK
jgi:hypothetical protein